MPTLIHMAGKRYGRLVVLRREPNAGTKVQWLCQCDCGHKTVARANNLQSGHTSSCGCYGAGLRRTHGRSDTPEYATWRQMLDRCENPKNKRYKDYGGRGIMVCERWHEPQNFLDDMGKRPSRKHSLDRVDNDGNYEPANCRWSTAVEQHNNCRSNRVLVWDGRSMTTAQWAVALGINASILRNRLYRKWSVERTLSQPVRVDGAVRS